MHHNMDLSVMEEGNPLHGGRRGPAGICLYQGTSVVAGGLWKLLSPQRWDTPGRGIPRRCHIAKLLTLASCTISYLLLHPPQ